MLRHRALSRAIAEFPMQEAREVGCHRAKGKLPTASALALPMGTANSRMMSFSLKNSFYLPLFLIYFVKFCYFLIFSTVSETIVESRVL